MAEMWISMGPQHPMTHGLWTLKVKVDGETVVDTEPDLGYIHRGVEKICETRDFTQIIPYCDRLCYASANTWSHAYIYAVEDLIEVEVPEGSLQGPWTFSGTILRTGGSGNTSVPMKIEISDGNGGVLPISTFVVNMSGGTNVQTSWSYVLQFSSVSALLRSI